MATLPSLLRPEDFEHHIRHFNTMEPETVVNAIPNSGAWDWMTRNIPLWECSDTGLEEMYYFRWWTYRKHWKQTPAGFVVTEFLTPVKHAGVYNTISCALGHHVAEGRWLRDQRYLDDYVRFWFRGNGGRPQPHFHRFSSWAPAAIWERFLVNGDKGFVIDLLPDLAADYGVWETERQTKGGLYYQFDVRDGMEESISGSRTAHNLRPTINSYMAGNAQAIAAIARAAGNRRLAREFGHKAAELKRLLQAKLWDAPARFYKVRFAEDTPWPSGIPLSDAREAIGFLPWRFGLALPEHGAAWAQFTDDAGFRAPRGMTTAERRHPKFRSHGIGSCEWDGAVWPFATSQTLDALANALRSGVRLPIARRDWWQAFLTYSRSQRQNDLPYVGEYLDEISGRWIKGNERSRYYNHSTYADLIIGGVAGLVPRADNLVEIDPLVPPDAAPDWFCLDNVRYHDRSLSIIWDKTGRRYNKDAGLSVFAGGRRIAHSPRLTRITGRLID
jgi:hypothetical protein